MSEEQNNTDTVETPYHYHQCYLCTDQFECQITDCSLEDTDESCLCDDCAADIEEGYIDDEDDYEEDEELFDLTEKEE